MKTTFQCIDAHTYGNPVRLVTGGVPFLYSDRIVFWKKGSYFSN
jgi:4-hydroxyproline epimerase